MLDRLIFVDPPVSILLHLEAGFFRCTRFLASDVLLKHKPPVGLPDCLLIKVPLLYPRLEHAQSGDEPTAVPEYVGDISQIVAFEDVKSLYVILDIEPLLWTRLGISSSLRSRSHVESGDRLGGRGGARPRVPPSW